jgi:hypothetical protein
MGIPHPFDMYDVARFFSKVNVKDELRCWEFIGYLDLNGYGKFAAIGTTFYAHRFSYILFKGRIEEDLLVRHKCDNPCCVNPYHLETGTFQDNTMDRDIRGRTAKGSKNGRAKITEGQALEIFLDERPYNEIANSFGIGRDMISRIKIGRSWGHVTGATPPKRY